MEINEGKVVDGKHVMIHFVDVGKGNCVIIQFPSGHTTFVDIDNSHTSEENTEPIEYFKSKKMDYNVFRFILTHPDMDHMSGLHELNQKYDIINFWDTENEKKLTEWDNTPYKEEDWDTYQSFKGSESDPKHLEYLRGADQKCCFVGDGITVLSPSYKMLKESKDAPDGDSEKYHHLSYVLMIEYSGLRVLLGGDASKKAWDDILEEWGEDALKANIFLAPHHGSKNNVNEEVFKHIKPDYVIVSVDEGTTYAYNYYNSISTVLTTKHYGTIKVRLQSNGKYTKYLEKNG